MTNISTIVGPNTFLLPNKEQAEPEVLDELHRLYATLKEAQWFTLRSNGDALFELYCNMSDRFSAHALLTLLRGLAASPFDPTNMQPWLRETYIQYVACVSWMWTCFVYGTPAAFAAIPTLVILQKLLDGYTNKRLNDDKLDCTQAFDAIGRLGVALTSLANFQDHAKSYDADELQEEVSQFISLILTQFSTTPTTTT